MKKNPKRGPFDSSVDLTQVPSFQTRFASMDRLTGGAIDMKQERVDTRVAKDAENLRLKLKSGADIRSTPSIILRRNGVKV